MAARIQRELSLLVISLIAAVISLPMAASVASALESKALAPVTQMLKAPVRIALDGSGGFYVTDPRSGGVQKYDASGAFVRLLKTSGSPQGVAVMANGNLVVTMTTYAAIIDNVTGLEVRRLGTAGTETAFGFADGVAIDSTGAIYVSDAKNRYLVKFDATGEYTQKIGEVKSDPLKEWEFLSPAGVTYDSVNNRIAVTDVMMGNVKFFSTDGVPQGTIGKSAPDSGPGNFTSPMAIAFEYTAVTTPVLRRMYVVDSFQSSIQVVDPAGAHLAYIGDYGSANGKLMVPTDAVYDKINKRLLVANGYGNITIYGIDGGKNPMPLSPAAAPVLTVNQPLSIVNSSALSLTGTVSAGTSVSCALNGVKAFPATITGMNWNCGVSGLAEGANSIDVVARNTSPVVVEKKYLVTYALGGPNLMVEPVAGYINVSTLPVSGTVDSGSTVQLCNLNPVETCYSATVVGTDWSYSVPVAPGANAITVKATKGGTTTATVSTFYDNTLPVLTLSAVPTGSTVARQVVNISGAATDSNLAGVTVDGNPVSVVNNRFSYPVVGKTSIPVIATDLAGNAVTQTINLNYDPSKVAVDFTSHADGAVVQNPAQTVTGTLSGNAALVKVNGDIVTVTNGAWSKGVSLTNDASNKGVNTVIVDADGAISKLTLVYDPANPAVAAVNPMTDKAVNTSTVQIAGTVGTNVQLSSVVAGVEVQQTSNAPFAVALNKEGVYPVVLKAKDQSLNVNQAVRNIIYDVTPPYLTVTSASGTVSTITGSAEPGAVVQVLELTTGQPIANAVVAYTGGNWTATLTPPRGVDNIDISATDAAGNVTSKTTFVPDGNININPTDLVFTDLDAIACMEIVVGTKTATRYQLAHGDIGPLVGGYSSPNGRIDVSDCILILRKASGSTDSWK